MQGLEEVWKAKKYLLNEKERVMKFPGYRNVTFSGVESIFFSNLIFITVQLIDLRFQK